MTSARTGISDLTQNRELENKMKYVAKSFETSEESVVNYMILATSKPSIVTR